MRKDIRIYSKDEIQQGTPEWFAIRELKFTASKADAISANGKGLETLVTELLAEYFSSQKYEEYTGKYKSPAMQRGNDFEAMARMVYEFETGNSVREVGFVEVTDKKYIGCSPDGLVTENGVEDILVEIKNHDDKVFAELQITENIDKKYIKQMQYQMWVTGAKACDYFGYNPNFSPSYFKKRLYPDEAMFKLFEAGVETGTQMIENGLAVLNKKLQKQEKFTETETEAEATAEKEPQEKAAVTETKTETVAVAVAVGEDFPF
jgi:predicted phage-related endonuclease